MKIEFTHSFIKRFKKRFPNNPKFQDKFDERIKLFSVNPDHSSLKDHALKGKKLGLRSFSISGDIRVIYYIKKQTAYCVDIGSHNQVY